MIKVVLHLVVAGLLVLPLAASALMDETEAQSVVASMLGEGKSASEVIAALMSDGRDLIDATIFSLVVGGQENRVAFAEAGIASARTLGEARSVANALIAAAGATGPVALAVEEALIDYEKSLAPPPTYRGSGIATGGGGAPVSPSD